VAPPAKYLQDRAVCDVQQLGCAWLSLDTQRVIDDGSHGSTAYVNPVRSVREGIHIPDTPNQVAITDAGSRKKHALPSA